MNWQDGGGQRNEIATCSIYDFTNATLSLDAILTSELLDIKVFSPLPITHNNTIPRTLITSHASHIL